MRLGLLGGTFDPIHVGHLDVAIAAGRAVPLDRVILVPSHVPPHRAEPHASTFHRFAMAAMAAQPHEMLAVSDLEMLAGGPSYTADTLTRLSAHGIDTRGLFFITGADAFRDIRSWKAFPSLLDRCHFVAVSRPGCRATILPEALPELAGRMRETPCAIPAEPCIFLVDAMTSPVSSTDVRRRIAEGLSIDGLVPEAVAAHIRRHDLYAAPTRKGPA
jgi:nicotinate-nucleotide adenylyltransferase